MNTTIKNILTILPALILFAIPALSMENLPDDKDEVKATMAHFEKGDRDCEEIYKGLCDTADLPTTGAENNESIGPEFSEQTLTKFALCDQMAKEIYESLPGAKTRHTKTDAMPTLTGTMSTYQVELVLVALAGIYTAVYIL